MKTIELSTASKSLAEYAEELDGGFVVLTRDDKPFAAIVPIKDIDLESLALCANDEFWTIINQARQEVAAGDTISLEAMKREVKRARVEHTIMKSLAEMRKVLKSIHGAINPLPPGPFVRGLPKELRTEIERQDRERLANAQLAKARREYRRVNRGNIEIRCLRNATGACLGAFVAAYVSIAVLMTARDATFLPLAASLIALAIIPLAVMFSPKMRAVRLLPSAAGEAAYAGALIGVNGGVVLLIVASNPTLLHLAISLACPPACAVIGAIAAAYRLNALRHNVSR